MYLYLVRHGQSEGNVLRTFHGQTDYPLTELGREQARRVGEKLRETPIARCLASDLSRAWETALICLEGRDMDPEACPALREQDVGGMEGLSWEEMGERDPGLRERYVEDWFHTVPPGGESPEEMAARVAACVDEAVRQGEDTLMVAHNGSLSLILAHLGVVSQDRAPARDWSFAQGAYSAIRVEGGRVELVAFNE